MLVFSFVWLSSWETDKKIGMPIKFSENSNNCEEKWIIDESIIVSLTSYINNKGEKCINLSFENIKM